MKPIYIVEHIAPGDKHWRNITPEPLPSKRAAESYITQLLADHQLAPVRKFCTARLRITPVTDEAKLRLYLLSNYAETIRDLWLRKLIDLPLADLEQLLLDGGVQDSMLEGKV